MDYVPIPVLRDRPSWADAKLGERDSDRFMLLIRRGIARFVDFELFSEPAGLVVAWLRPAQASPHYLSRGIAVAVLAFVFGAVLYEVVLIKLWGQTLGKLLMGICVVDCDNEHLRWRSAFVRWLVVGAVPFVFGNSGFSWAPWISAGWFFLIVASILIGKGRGLHDHAARSRVVSFSAYTPATESA